MNTYLLIFMIALVSSLLFTPVVRRTCERFGWFDEPKDSRRVHRAAIPRMGGVVIVFSLMTALGTLFFIRNQVTESLAADRWRLLSSLIPAGLVFVIGVVDDRRGLPPRFKLLAQAAAASMFFALGGRIEALSVPVLGYVQLPGWISFLITVAWIIAITNAFNLIDGLDGLASGAALFAAVVMIAISIVTGHPFVTVTALALAGALIGFLRYNFYPASIFLGDSGSLLIGFLLATLSIRGIQKASMAVAVAIPLLAFGVPVVDTGLALLRRFLSKRPLFQGDREHIHHKLLARGWSQRRVALVLYGVCALFGMQALLFTQVGQVSRITGLWLFIVGVAVIVGVDRLHYHEMDEIREGLRRSLSLSERRLRLANNIRVRRASLALSKAATLEEFFAAVRDVLELSGFVCASVQLDHSDLPQNKEIILREQAGDPTNDFSAQEDAIFWLWEKSDIKSAEVINSAHFRSLRLSLSTTRGQWGYINLYRPIDSDAFVLDVSYLCSFFQNEAAAAAERLLRSSETKEDDDRMFASPACSPAIGFDAMLGEFQFAAASSNKPLTSTPTN